VGSFYRGKIKWSHAERRFVAWCEGCTGYPLIDAGMRRLQREGWMHNRARLAIGSFLTKDLGIDWRWGGERAASRGGRAAFWSALGSDALCGPDPHQRPLGGDRAR
jgi:hypothetical protein